MKRALESAFAWTFFRFLPEYGIFVALLASFAVGVFSTVEFVAWVW